MNFLDKTFWDMEKTCISVVLQNKSIWTNFDLIKTDVENLIKNEKDLHDAAQAQTENETGGHVAQKHLEMQQVAEKCYKLGRNLCHLAKKSNNMVLLASVDITESAFFARDEKDTMILFNKMLEAGRANIKDLAVYNLTAANLDDLEARIKKLAAIPEIINTVSGNRKSATRNIKEIIAEARSILDLLDNAFEGIIEDEKFLEAWFDARKIKGRHSGSKKNNQNGEQNISGTKTIEK
jgi:hypothetical protein